MDAEGNFVAVWIESDGSSQGIFGRRFAANGNALGNKFRINTWTTDRQLQPSISMDDSGNFVVTWYSEGGDGADWGISARRYASNGQAIGNEFVVNTWTTSAQMYSTVAMNASGQFIITWQSYAQGTSCSSGCTFNIFGQRYAADGTPSGSEFQINTWTSGSKGEPAAAIDEAGNFMVAWYSYHDGNSSGIFARRYAADGTQLTGEFQVNTWTAGNQWRHKLAMNQAGKSVVTWSSSHDGSSDGTFAQRFNSAGVTQGPEFQANTWTTNAQYFPDVALDAEGNFVIVWHSDGQDGSEWGIYGQRYAADGSTLGGEFRINTQTAGTQNYPAIAMQPNGDFVVVWSSAFGGVRAQRYDSNGNAL